MMYQGQPGVKGLPCHTQLQSIPSLWQCWPYLTGKETQALQGGEIYTTTFYSLLTQADEKIIEWMENAHYMKNLEVCFIRNI